MRCSIHIASLCACLSLGCENLASVSSSGNDAGPGSESDGGTGLPSCSLDAGVSTLYEAGPSTLGQPVIFGGSVLLTTTTAIVVVPLAGGDARILASAEAVSAPVVFGQYVYYQGLETVPGSAPTGPQPSETQLFQVPLSGGPPTALSMLKNFAPVASDGSYIYLRDANGLARWAPPADPEAEIPVAANLLVGGIAAQGDFIYLSAQDV